MESLETSEREKKLWGLRTILPCISRMQALGERCVCAGVDGVVTMIAE